MRRAAESLGRSRDAGRRSDPEARAGVLWRALRGVVGGKGTEVDLLRLGSTARWSTAARAGPDRPADARLSPFRRQFTALKGLEFDNVVLVDFPDRERAVPDGVAGFVDGPGSTLAHRAAEPLGPGHAARATRVPPASTTRWSRSGSPTSPTTASGGSRWACASGSDWPPRCSPSRGCWCSTSRPTVWTRPASTTCTASSPGSPRRDRGGPVQPPDGRPRRAVLRGHHPRHRTGRLLRAGEQARRRERRARLPAAHLRPAAARRVAVDMPGLRVVLADAASGRTPSSWSAGRCRPWTSWSCGWCGPASRCESWRPWWRRSRPRSWP